jgi:hypothetical protein
VKFSDHREGFLIFASGPHIVGSRGFHGLLLQGASNIMFSYWDLYTDWLVHHPAFSRETGVYLDSNFWKDYSYGEDGTAVIHASLTAPPRHECDGVSGCPEIP